MKRICFGLLLLCAVGFLACENKSNNNNNAANVNGTASPSPSPAPGTNTTPTISVGVDVPITIIISDKSGKPAIASVSPDPADLTGGKMADWTVVNRSSTTEGQDSSVDIGSFKGNVTGGGLPFGMRPSQNDFFLDLLQEGTTRQSISNPSKDNGRDDTYKYTITLYQKDGKQLDQLDPQIIVGIRTTVPKTGATPAPPPPQASPTKSATKK
jgi:hypothetical protein